MFNSADVKQAPGEIDEVSMKLIRGQESKFRPVTMSSPETKQDSMEKISRDTDTLVDNKERNLNYEQRKESIQKFTDKKKKRQNADNGDRACKNCAIF